MSATGSATIATSPPLLRNGAIIGGWCWWSRFPGFVTGRRAAAAGAVLTVAPPRVGLAGCAAPGLTSATRCHRAGAARRQLGVLHRRQPGQVRVVILDKSGGPGAHLRAAGDGSVAATTPALLGPAIGDDSVPGIGDKCRWRRSAPKRRRPMPTLSRRSPALNTDGEGRDLDRSTTRRSMHRRAPPSRRGSAARAVGDAHRAGQPDPSVA